VFADEDIRRDFGPALSRTLKFTAMNYVMLYVFGLGLALLMFEIGFRGGMFSVIFLPAMISGLATGFIAVMLFSPTAGTLNLLLMKIGLIERPLDIKASGGATFLLPVFLGWRGAGLNMAIFLNGLMAIPRETIDAARVDGASYLQRLRHVYFPQMIPSFVIATTLCLVSSFRVFDELIALGALYGNKEAEMLSVVFFKYGFGGGRLALGMTIAFVVGIPLIAIAVLLQRVQRRMEDR
jgi:ABC-type sugar transport system permease subunit